YRTPQVGLVSGLTGRRFAGEERPDAAYWQEHARQPGRPADGIQTLAQQGCAVWLEIGPQPALNDLARQSLKAGQPLMLSSLRHGRDEWQTLLSSLARLYVAGAPVEWSAFDRDYPRRKVSLPTYPFQRRRYWPAQGMRRHGGSGPAPHPLLGPMTRSAAEGAFLFDTTLSRFEPAWLGDHPGRGAPVPPATACLEAALASSREVLPDQPVVLEQAEFREALVLPEQGGCSVQTVLTPRGEGALEWRLYGRVGESRQNGADWTLHA